MSPRVGLVGCGRWGRNILRDLIACGAEVHVTCATAATAAAAEGLGAASASVELPLGGGIDGYVVATPTATHAEVLRRLAPRGRPIFVEKPMTADPASARQLAEAAPDAIFVMDKWRYHPAIQEMRRAAQAGELGDLLAIRTTRWQWSSPHRDVDPLWILAPHDLSIAYHLLGRLPPVRDAAPVVWGRPELGVVARFADEAGPLVSLDVGVVCTEHRRRVLVVGSKATLELGDAYDDRLTARRGLPGAADATEEIVAVGTGMPLLAEIQTFVAYLRCEGPPPMSSAAEGALVVERLAEIERRLSE